MNYGGEAHTDLRGVFHPSRDLTVGDVWPEFIPTSTRKRIKNARFAVPVYKTYGTTWSDGAEQDLVGFLMVPAGLRPTARTDNWTFVEVTKTEVGAA